jgi:homocysteine S-methyltransferase
VPQTASGDNTDAYRAIVGHFLSLGASNFLFETFSESECLSLLAGEIKSRRPDAFVICSFASCPTGTPAPAPWEHSCLNK